MSKETVGHVSARCRVDYYHTLPQNIDALVKFVAVAADAVQHLMERVPRI